MPTQVVQDDNANNEIRVKTAYKGEVMITYIHENITFEELSREIRGICRFSVDQVIMIHPNYHIWMLIFMTDDNVYNFGFFIHYKF